MASTDAMPVPKKNTAYRLYFALRKSDGTLVDGEAWTGQDTELSQDGGTFADATNEATQIATTSGAGYVDLTASEMNNDSVVVKVSVTNTNAVPLVVTLYPEEAGDIRVNANQIGDSTNAATRLAASAETIVKGTVDTVTNTHTPTATEFQADDITESTSSHFNGRVVIFTSGALQNQATNITAYSQVGGIGQFTVDSMTEAPANNDTFVIV